MKKVSNFLSAGKISLHTPHPNTKNSLFPLQDWP